MKIYIVLWNTESGDEGVAGYWTERPTKKQLDVYMRENYEEEFVDNGDGTETEYIYWELVELEKLKPI